MVLDSWKRGERWSASSAPPKPTRADKKNDLVAQALANLENLSREDILDFIDMNALGGIGRNVSVFRRTRDTDQLREALMTLQVTDAALRMLLERATGRGGSSRPRLPGSGRGR